VNIPDSFKKMTPRERLMILLGSGLIMIYLLFYAFPSEEVAVTQTIPSQKPITPNKIPANSFVMPLTPQNEQAMRNPFATIPEIKEQKDPMLPNTQSTENVSARTEKLSVKLEKGDLKLTGLIGTTDHHLAIIQTSSKSKAYQVNEFIGSYQLIAVNETSAILKNADEQIVLHLEPARQKGGDQREK
jgi:Tfp pilus assembly protein PilP